MNNKYQEALNTLTDWFHSYKNEKGVTIHERHITPEYEKAKKVIQELVNKETPKKVYKGDYSNIDPLQFGWYHCPNCKKGLIPISYKKAIKLANYCLHCGQKLDWSEENE